VRTRCLLYTHLVLDPAKSGLTHFTQAFRRADPYLGALAKLADPLDDDPLLPVHAAEVRVSPGRVREWLETVARWPRPTALVAHFIRGDGQKTPAATVEGLMRDARDLAGHIDTHPESLETLRALDVAGNEATGPLWQVVPALRHVQRVAEEIARWAPVDPLHLTLHVGEDFEHLLSGLRAVDEPLAWDLVGRGDRLGHALALGWKPEKWAWGKPSVEVKRGDRLLDLGWSLWRLEGLASRRGEDGEAARRWIPLVQRRLKDLLRNLGLANHDTDGPKDLFHLLGCPEEVLHMSTTRFAGPITTLHELWWAWMHQAFPRPSQRLEAQRNDRNRRRHRADADPASRHRPGSRRHPGGGGAQPLVEPEHRRPGEARRSAALPAAPMGQAGAARGARHPQRG
jgi:hypothetical protein